jgi:hypothetical protein
MRHFLRHLPLLALAACATNLSGGQAQQLASSGIGCERAEYGPQARRIAVYTRVVAERVCVLDAAGQCHPRVVGGTVTAEIRLPQTSNAPPVDALRQELGRRGILARIARPRGPKMYASLGTDIEDGLLVLELGEIQFSEAGDMAHVMVRTSGTMDASEWRAAPGGDVMRVVRTADVARACWRLERSSSSALAD